MSDVEVGWTPEERIAWLEAEVRRLRAQADEGRSNPAEHMLKLGDAEFRAIADSIDQMIWSTRADGFHDYYNRRWYQFTGVPEGTTDGEAWSGMFHPDDQQRAWQLWRRCLETGDPYHIEYRLRHRSGEYRWVLGRARPVRSETGAILRWYGTCTDIHDQKVSQDRLRESEARLRALTDNLPMALVYQIATDRAMTQRQFTYLSANCEKLLGVSSEDVLADPGTLYGAVPPDMLPRLQAAEAAAAADLSTFDVEIPLRRPRMPDMVARLISEARVLPGDRLIWDGLLIDVTERTAAEASSREAGQRLDAVLSNTRMAVFLMNEDMRCIYANAAAEQLTGFSLGELEGRSLHDTLHHSRPDGSPYPMEECPIGQALPIGSRAEGEETFVHKDGSFYPVAYTASPIHDEAGRAIGTVLEVRATAEERARDAALARHSGQLQGLAEAALAIARAPDLPAMLHVITERARLIIGAHQAVISLTRGPDWSQAISAVALSDKYAAWRNYDRLPSGAGIYAWVCQVNRPARFTQDELEAHPRWRGFGEHQAEHPPMRGWLAVPIVARDGRNLGLVQLSDKEDGAEFDAADEAILLQLAQLASAAIEQSLAETALRDLNDTLEQRVAQEIEQRTRTEEALRQAQKMELVGQLTGGIAHDFNNLLQVVTGNLDLLLRALPEDPPRLRRSAENALKGAARAATLTQRLLAFSRRQPLAPKPIDPNKLISDMSELLHRTLGETVEFETVLAPELWPVEIDAHQLENAILNLAVNARDAIHGKHPHGGGKLMIETANVTLDQSSLATNAEVTPGPYAAILVSDTGTGMDAETASRAFEPFFTTKEVGKGTGLGLSMVYGFVKQSGGHLDIYSEPGQGTTVKIYLPRLTGKAVDLDEDAAPDNPPPQGRSEETILVCEDDDDVRTYTVEVLRQLGYRVLEAHDGPSALRLLDRQEHGVDLLFTDVVLPAGMNGEEVAARAREMRPDLKVLFTTGYARNAVVHHGRLERGVELLTKPFAFADLAAKVREILDRQG